MIMVFVEECKEISQDCYDEIIGSIPPYRFRCSCGHSGCLTIHGYYERGVKLPTGAIRIKIIRLKCSECGRTHAVLLTSLAPYSQVRLKDQALLIRCYEDNTAPKSVMEDNPELSPTNVSHIISMYLKHWRERLYSYSIPLHPMAELVKGCFRWISRQFMQIKKTPNVLFLYPT